MGSKHIQKAIKRDLVERQEHFQIWLSTDSYTLGSYAPYSLADLPSRRQLHLLDDCGNDESRPVGLQPRR
jgi:hypothetical protein